MLGRRRRAWWSALASSIRAAADGQPLLRVACARGVLPKTVRLWIERFNAQGIKGLDDAPRSGRPPTYTPEQIGELVALARTKPDMLGLPFGCWTIDRLATYVHEVRARAAGHPYEAHAHR